jgi:tetraacyldisaccharide 4'-kinase|tara:strand:+ start:30323 stop:31336 length:1014 start_codon:yes stop_codon:yes gene_type:complete
MNRIRLFLFPFAILYTLITSLRNSLFNLKILKSHKFEIPLIGIGNLSSGGTGKTPMAEYIFKLFSNEFKLALLSRGFKRSSNGYIKANDSSNSNEIGDEPFQIFSKFKDVDVAVDENRVRGVTNLLKDNASLHSIVLDDCFQHRSISLQLNILLTTFKSPFYRDFVLPCGDLRELKSGYKRADLVVITKCPNDLSKKVMEEIRREVSLKSHQKLFFTSIKYNNCLSGESEMKISDLNNLKVLLVTGIANDNEIVNYLKSKNIQFDKISFSDHYNYSLKDIQKIELEHSDRIIITTEKDYQKIKLINKKNKWYYLQIEITFLDNQFLFKKIIRDTIIK